MERSANLTIAANADNEGTFQVVVSNDYGEDARTIDLFIRPSITMPPQDITAAEGEEVTFTVVAAGTEPLTYQWTHGGEPVGSETSLTVTASDDAAGAYTVVVSNDYGNATASATLTVTGTPVHGGMVLIPGGTNSGTDPDFGAYSLTVSSFYMDRYPVTKALWDEVYNWAIANGYSFDNVGSGKAANHPVHTINWYDAV